MDATSFEQHVVVSPEVRAALAARRAVVALESTIITHGMPHPANLSTARSVEALVREHGAIPATIAVLDGVLHVGLADAGLARIAEMPHAAKASRRDLATLMVRGASAGTTVAATLYAAARAGIAIFATGGVGGVHRGAETTFDVSADLIELATTPVAIVCAGVKSILDIPKTLEYLETHGVPVLGYRTHEFPAFYTRTSGAPIDHRVESARDLARILAQHEALGMRCGVLVANPIPVEDALDPAVIDAWIAQALRDADARGLSGKLITPFLLDRINELSGGASLTANIALVKNNAVLAAQIAVERSRLA